MTIVKKEDDCHTCDECDWFENQIKRCELYEKDADEEDDACEDFKREE